jgi:mono/diheme cytochrome c family protein
MREGVDREGRHLYPVFPYDHFTLVKDEDIRALYAYFMTRGSVRATAPANDVPFPLNLRPLIAGWKVLFLRPGPYAPDAAQSDVWNRGAYLVEGLAHCGACHTPRNILGAEKTQDRFAGGEAEGWTAYALNQASPAPVPWDSEALRIYLRNGWHEAHGVARGPMAPVIDNLASIPDSDLRAMTTYMVAIIGEPSAQRRLAGKALIEHAHKPGPRSEPASTETQTVAGSDHPRTPGALIYQAACASCHESGRPLPFGGIDLALSTGPSGPDARNVINVVLWGLPPAEGERSPIMPGFAGSFSDQQLAALLSYMRSRFSDKPAWADIEKDIRDARTGRRPVMVYPAPGTDPAQAALSQRKVQ